MSVYYGATSVDEGPFDNRHPHVRVNLDGGLFARLFNHRERLIGLSRETPAPIALTYNSNVQFGRITYLGPLYNFGGRLDSGALVQAHQLRRNDPGIYSTPQFKATDRGGEQTEFVTKSGVEFKFSPKSGFGSNFWVPWRDLEVLYAEGPCSFLISEDVTKLAAAILAESATDRMPILADALDECGAPPWIGRGLREDQDWANGWLHLLYVCEDYMPTTQVTPFFRSLAGLVPYELVDEVCDDGGAGMSTCRECGEPCFVDPEGVAIHVDDDGETDHDLDENHVAIPEEEEDDAD